jgi:hypothetical protein
LLFSFLSPHAWHAQKEEIHKEDSKTKIDRSIEEDKNVGTLRKSKGKKGWKNSGSPCCLNTCRWLIRVSPSFLFFLLLVLF